MIDQLDCVRNVAIQFEDAETEHVVINTSFRNIEGWNSLTALAVIAMVDEIYNVKLTGEDIRVSHTIKDLYNKVQDRESRLRK
jgi:acyl carrier protein